MLMNNKEYLQIELREKAENNLFQESALSINKLKSMSIEEIAEKMHELSVYQIELEMQNDELYKTQEQLYKTQEQLSNEKGRYLELYNMAPVAYLTLSSEGLILETNLTSAEILATSTEALKSQALSNFIYSEDQDIYYMFRKKIASSKKRQNCEVRMRNSEGKVFWTQIIVSSKKESSEHSTWQLVFSDISEARALQDIIKEHNEMLHNLTRNILQARENERKSIAREVHDQLGQLMSAFKIDLTWLKRKLPQDSQELMTKVNTMLEHISLAIQSVQGIVVQLRPPILDDLGLEAAMKWHVQTYLKSANIQYNISFKAEESVFNEDLKIVLFRVVQEALTNVIRHSNATECSLLLTQEGETLILEITDNGIGVTQKQIENPKSFGLIGIRERLYPYAGRLSVSGHEGTATTLTITIENFKKELKDD